MPQRHRNWWPGVHEFIHHAHSPHHHHYQPHDAPTQPAAPLKNACKTLGQLESELLSQSSPPRDNHRPRLELRAAVLLTETSQELLLSIVPPLHPLEAATSPLGVPQPLGVPVGEPCSSVQQLLSCLPASLGTEVQVEIVGIAADDRSQAVAVHGPPWMVPADSCAPHPYLLISHVPEAHPSEAGRLIASGIAGLVGECYQPLDEGLPVVGLLGVLCSDGSSACTHDQLQRLVQSLGADAGQANGHATVCARAGAGVGAQQQLSGNGVGGANGGAGEQLLQAMAALSASGCQGSAASTAHQTCEDAHGKKAGEVVDGSGEEAGGAVSAASDAAGEAKGGAGALPAAAAAAAGPAEDDEFEVWMQLDEHAAPGVHLPPKPAHPPPSAPTASASLVVPDDLPPPVAGERMRWLDDVREGDLVEVVPLSHKQGEVEERVKGIVDEVVVDDLFQSQGVLVRLQEDNTMGHVARVIASQHRQQQEAWPSLTPGTGPSAGASTAATADDEYPRSTSGVGAAPAATATTDDSEVEGLEAGLGGAGKAARPRRQQRTVTANRPAGGVQVLYKSSKKGRPQGGGGPEFLAKQLQWGGLQAGAHRAADDEAARNVRALETWQALQDLYGEYVTAAVLKDCKGDLEEAIATLLDQESLPDRLAAIVEHSVQQVEDEVSAAAAAAAAQEAARYERAAGGRPRRGGWAVRPGAYSSSKPQASNPDHFPSLSSHCDRTSRHPRQARPWQRQKQQGMTERDWGANETLTGPIKVLQNTDSLGALAAQHGLSVRDVEALKQLFPTLDNHFVASTLADMKGDVNAAFEYLVDAGILPGHQSDMDGLLDFLSATTGSDASLNDITAALNGSNPLQNPLQPGNGSYLAAAVSPTPGVNGDSTPQPPQPDLSILGDPHEPLSFEEKVVRLMGAFEGLDGSLAEFTLRHCGEDLRGAAAFLNECVHADNSAAAAANAKSEALAAAIGRPDSYAGVTEEHLPPSLGTQASNGLAAALQGQKGPTQQQQQQQQQQVANQARQQRQQGFSTDGLQPLQGKGEFSAGVAGGASALQGHSTAEAGWQSVGRAAAGGSNGYSSRGMGASAKDAADKERSRLQAGKARQIAHIYFNFRNVFFQQANAAYNAGDGKAAAEYSRRGRHYGELAKQFRQASNEAAFKASNLGIRNTFVMDLHGMHVNEAVALLEKQMDALGRLISPEGVLLRCITGWGAHSAKGIALIKPAVMDWAKQNGRKHFVDPDNEGVVIVHVTPQNSYS